MSRAAADPSKPGSAVDPNATVEVVCPHCGSRHPVRAKVLGKLTRCTACAQRFVLRREEPGEAPAATENSAVAPAPAPSGPAPSGPAPSGPDKAPARPVAAPPIATPPPFQPPPDESSIEPIPPPPPPPPSRPVDLRPDLLPAPQPPSTPQTIAIRDDAWGVCSIVLAAFSLGFASASSVLLLPFATGGVLAGLCSALFAKRGPLLVTGLVLNGLLGLLLLISLIDNSGGIGAASLPAYLDAVQSP